MPHISIRRVVRRFRPSRRALVAVGLLTMVELVGRHAASTDLHDLVAVPVVWLALLVAGRSVWGPIGRGLARSVRALHERWSCDYGVDLRGSPPVARALPPVFVGSLLLAAMLTGSLAAMTRFVSPDFRALAPVFYTLHVVALSITWALLIATGFLTAAIGAAVVHNAFVGRHVDPTRRSIRVEVLLLSALLLLSVGAAFVLPGWAALLAIAAAGLVRGMRSWAAGGPRLEFLWRRKREGSPVRALPFQALESYWAAMETCVFLGVFMLAGAGEWLGLAPPSDAAPITAGLRTLAAWVSAVSLATYSFLDTLEERVLWRANPARPCPLRLRIQPGDGLPDEDRAAVETLARGRGWQVSGAEPKPGELPVSIRLLPSPMPPLGADPVWPLAVSARALEVPELQELLERRDVIQRRRALRRVLARLFRRAARRKYKAGSGFLVAPHLWFVPGLTRDVDDPEPDREGSAVFEIIGPHYRKVLPWAARAHLHAVLDEAEIDMIFVEDGVGCRRFLWVLDRVFEHYDGPRGRLEERHLTGGFGVRCFVQEYELENPGHRKGYPEPDYEELARARILVVFKDRGDGEQQDEVPLTLDRLLLTG
jgi:hypothetical protein